MQHFLPYAGRLQKGIHTVEVIQKMAGRMDLGRFNHDRDLSSSSSCESRNNQPGSGYESYYSNLLI